MTLSRLMSLLLSHHQRALGQCSKLRTLKNSSALLIDWINKCQMKCLLLKLQTALWCALVYCLYVLCFLGRSNPCQCCLREAKKTKGISWEWKCLQTPLPYFDITLKPDAVSLMFLLQSKQLLCEVCPAVPDGIDHAVYFSHVHHLSHQNYPRPMQHCCPAGY